MVVATGSYRWSCGPAELRVRQQGQQQRVQQRGWATGAANRTNFNWSIPSVQQQALQAQLQFGPLFPMMYILYQRTQFPLAVAVRSLLSWWCVAGSPPPETSRRPAWNKFSRTRILPNFTTNIALFSTTNPLDYALYTLWTSHLETGIYFAPATLPIWLRSAVLHIDTVCPHSHTFFFNYSGSAYTIGEFNLVTILKLRRFCIVIILPFSWNLLCSHEIVL